MNLVKKYVYIGLGSLCFGIGVIGVFFPVLPTTPFLLMASYFYLKSSDFLYNWLMNHKVFGKYIYSYVNYKGVSKSAKIGSILFLWTTLGISTIITSSFHLRIFLLIVGVAVTTHIYLLKTLSTEELEIIEARYAN